MWLLIFLLMTANAFAYPCIGHVKKEPDVAMFRNPTDAKEFADKHNGTIITSQDGETFTVLYLTTTVVTNVPDDCGGEE